MFRSDMTPLLTPLVALAFLASWFCLRAEKHSKRFPDRALLFAAGFLFALGCCGAIWIAVLI